MKRNAAAARMTDEMHGRDVHRLDEGRHLRDMRFHAEFALHESIDRGPIV